MREQLLSGPVAGVAPRECGIGHQAPPSAFQIALVSAALAAAAH
jgi:hypothetical protein